ncbi:MAG: DUF4412 domain-containing protein, partial [Candidatus Aminicenantales bacterium]
VLSIALLPHPAKADSHIKKFRHTDAMTIMGQTQPAKDEEGATWMTKDKMREDEGKSRSTIVRLDLKKIYVIDHEKKEYVEIDLPIDFEKILPSEAKQMMQMMEVTAKVTETQEVQKIKKWDCKKYLVEIGFSMMGMNMPMKMDMWVTKGIDIDFNLYEKFQTEMLSLQPIFKDFIEEFKKIKGYPVLTEMTMTMMGTETKTKEEVISVEKKNAPEGTYDIPEGYSKSETFNPFEQKR